MMTMLFANTAAIATRLMLACLKFFQDPVTCPRLVEKRGFQSQRSVDIQHGPHHDLTRHSTQSFLCSVILQCNLFYCHFGTPCTVFSMARKGLKNMFAARAKERVSCELAFYTAKLCEICMSVGTFWSIENPVSSALWEFFPIQQLMQRADVFVVEFPMCAYGAPYRKLTRR